MPSCMEGEGARGRMGMGLEGIVAGRIVGSKWGNWANSVFLGVT